MDLSNFDIQISIKLAMNAGDLICHRLNSVLESCERLAGLNVSPMPPLDAAYQGIVTSAMLAWSMI